jgi:hypothetical protein
VDFADADADLAARVTDEDADPERWFHREWVRGLFADALGALERRCREHGHTHAFELFRRYDVEDASPRQTYAALAAELGIRATDVTNELAWARRAFREIVLDALRRACASDAEFRAEARDLFGTDPS